jgi:hypothetical protein
LRSRPTHQAYSIISKVASRGWAGARRRSAQWGKHVVGALQILVAQVADRTQLVEISGGGQLPRVSWPGHTCDVEVGVVIAFGDGAQQAVKSTSASPHEGIPLNR